MQDRRTMKGKDTRLLCLKILEIALEVAQRIVAKPNSSALWSGMDIQLCCLLAASLSESSFGELYAYFIFPWICNSRNITWSPLVHARIQGACNTRKYHACFHNSRGKKYGIPSVVFQLCFGCKWIAWKFLKVMSWVGWSWKMLKAKIQVCRSKDPLSPAAYCLLSSTECQQLISISWNMHFTCCMGRIWPHDGSQLTGRNTFSGHDFLSEAGLWSCRWAPQRQAASRFKSDSNHSIGEIIYPRRAQRFLQSQKPQQHDKRFFFWKFCAKTRVQSSHQICPCSTGCWSTRPAELDQHRFSV